MAHEDKNPLLSERVREQLLLQRILVLDGVLDDDNGTLLATQLLTLAAEDTGQPVERINCEGGDLPSMLAVYDTMQYIEAPVATTCVGQAIGVGAVLLAAGTPGRRALLPHARVVLHQPAGRGQGPIHHRARRARPGRARRGRPGQRDSLLAAQVAGDLFGQLDEAGAQRAGQGRDHLAGRLLAAALDLGEVLRRYPGPGRRLGQRLRLFLAEGPEPPAEHLPPEGLLGTRFRLRFPPQRVDVRAFGNTSAYERSVTGTPCFATGKPQPRPR